MGINPADDAAVWKIDNSRSLVLTTDFFTPIVDEPYDYGAIAAANSLSDIYAMGATPLLALNIAAFPPALPAEILSQIVLGAAEKAREAGIVIAGGHTIQDQEPKFGLVVLGIVETSSLLKKSALQVEDEILITKPLGIGVTTTALKSGKASREDIDLAKKWMKMLNAGPSQISTRLGLKAATDVTGFALLGHLWEMVSSSNLAAEINFDAIPFLESAYFYGNQWLFAGGAFNNRLFYEKEVVYIKNIDDVSKMLMFDPQTSGGLLIACPPDKLAAFHSEAQQLNIQYWKIGRIVEGNKIFIK